MVFEILFLLLLILGVCVVAYRGAIHEFQILQRDYEPNTTWRDLISEQLPIVVRNIPKHWMGGWTRSNTEQKQWTVFLRDNGKRFRTTWNVWIGGQHATMPENIQEITSAMKLHTVSEHMVADGFSHWSWIPVYPVHPICVSPGGYRGVRKTVAECTGIVATDGGPIELWISHEGAVPPNVAERLTGTNPWEQTTKEIPWIDTVKFIEVKLRPGNAIYIPRHWWYAIRCPKENTNAAWYLHNEFHTPISWLVSKIKNDGAGNFYTPH